MALPPISTIACWRVAASITPSAGDVVRHGLHSPVAVQPGRIEPFTPGLRLDEISGATRP
jgi:hypothetical protein